VDTPKPPVTVVALGDSLTDGNGSTPGANTPLARLPGRAPGAARRGGAERRHLRRPPAEAGMGRAALERAGATCSRMPGVRAMVVLLGTNDIGWPGGPFAPDEKPMRADEMIQGLRQLIAHGPRAQRAHHGRHHRAQRERAARHAARRPPFGRERWVRQAVNRWIRESGAFDAVVDFDALLRDPARPSRLKAAMDSGDHLHPGDAGYKAMAALIDLEGLGVPIQP
jgi:lysophospholipase L1-like esterase